MHFDFPSLFVEPEATTAQPLPVDIVWMWAMFVTGRYVRAVQPYVPHRCKSLSQNQGALEKVSGQESVTT
jgi:hypothetical protein